MSCPLRSWLLIVAGIVSLAPATARAVGGLAGSYYLFDGSYLEDFTFSDPRYTHQFDRVDPAITFGTLEEHVAENNGNGLGFDWEPFGPGAGAFGVRWDGEITIPTGQSVYLGTESDDGSYVFINDGMFVNNGGQHWPWFRWSNSRLGPGTYRITTYLFANDLTPPHDKSGIDLWWSTDRYVVNASGWVPTGWLTPPTYGDTPPPAVPEPSSLALLMGGIAAAAGFGGPRRWRRRSAAGDDRGRPAALLVARVRSEMRVAPEDAQPE